MPYARRDIIRAGFAGMAALSSRSHAAAVARLCGEAVLSRFAHMVRGRTIRIPGRKPPRSGADLDVGDRLRGWNGAAMPNCHRSEAMPEPRRLYR